MNRYALLLAPLANRVYGGQLTKLATAELGLTCPFAAEISTETIGGVDYLTFCTATKLTTAQFEQLGSLSAALALFELVEPGLAAPNTVSESKYLFCPRSLPDTDLLPEDLVTILKYPGKTNEQFTRLMVNLALAVAQKNMPPERLANPLDILDPMCGRGTTLLTSWRCGHHSYGVEQDPNAITALAGYLKTYLRRNRYRHSAAVTPVKRNGKSLGKRFDAEVSLPNPELTSGLKLGVFTGDCRESGILWGKKKFDAIITDAPYGVAKGSVSGSAGGRKVERSATALLSEAIPVWASQLKNGGVLAISWNTLGLAREKLHQLATDAGLQVSTGGYWDELSHRVDSSIQRDLMIASKTSPE